MTQATPRPWVTDPEFNHQCVLGVDGVIVADCSITVGPIFELRTNKINEANAALIVRAVNERDELIEALEAMVGEFKNSEHDGCDCFSCKTVKSARTTLSRAKEEK